MSFAAAHRPWQALFNRSLSKSLHCQSSYIIRKFYSGKSEEPYDLEESMLNKIEEYTKQLQNGSKVDFKVHAQDFCDTPIKPIEEQPKLGKNKYNQFETPITSDIDEEINRLNSNGLNSRQISAVLAKKGTMISWQRVQKRFSFIERKVPKKVPQNPFTRPKSPEPQMSYPTKVPVTPKQAERLGLSSNLAQRIILLNGQKLSPHSISDALEEESGTILSECQIMDIIVRVARGEI